MPNSTRKNNGKIIFLIYLALALAAGLSDKVMAINECPGFSNRHQDFVMTHPHICSFWDGTLSKLQVQANFGANSILLNPVQWYEQDDVDCLYSKAPGCVNPEPGTNLGGVIFQGYKHPYYAEVYYWRHGDRDQQDPDEYWFSMYIYDYSASSFVFDGRIHYDTIGGVSLLGPYWDGSKKVTLAAPVETCNNYDDDGDGIVDEGPSNVAGSLCPVWYAVCDMDGDLIKRNGWTVNCQGPENSCSDSLENWVIEQNGEFDSCIITQNTFTPGDDCDDQDYVIGASGDGCDNDKDGFIDKFSLRYSSFLALSEDDKREIISGLDCNDNNPGIENYDITNCLCIQGSDYVLVGNVKIVPSCSATLTGIAYAGSALCQGTGILATYEEGKDGSSDSKYCLEKKTGKTLSQITSEISAGNQLERFVIRDAMLYNYRCSQNSCEQICTGGNDGQSCGNGRFCKNGFCATEFEICTGLNVGAECEIGRVCNSNAQCVTYCDEISDESYYLSSENNMFNSMYSGLLDKFDYDIASDSYLVQDQCYYNNDGDAFNFMSGCAVENGVLVPKLNSYANCQIINPDIHSDVSAFCVPDNQGIDRCASCTTNDDCKNYAYCDNNDNTCKINPNLACPNSKYVGSFLTPGSCQQAIPPIPACSSGDCNELTLSSSVHACCLPNIGTTRCSQSSNVQTYSQTGWKTTETCSGCAANNLKKSGCEIFNGKARCSFVDASQEVCGDGIDNNCNGQVDEPVASALEICWDRIDNNCDGRVDEFLSSVQEVCGDEIDNNCDGQIDEGAACGTDYICNPDKDFNIAAKPNLNGESYDAIAAYSDRTGPTRVYVNGVSKEAYGRCVGENCVPIGCIELTEENEVFATDCNDADANEQELIQGTKNSLCCKTGIDLENVEISNGWLQSCNQCKAGFKITDVEQESSGAGRAESLPAQAIPDQVCCEEIDEDNDGIIDYDVTAKKDANGNIQCVAVEKCQDKDNDGYDDCPTQEEIDKYGLAINLPESSGLYDNKPLDCIDEKYGKQELPFDVSCPLTEQGCNEGNSVCSICVHPNSDENAPETLCDAVDNNCIGRCQFNSAKKCLHDGNCAQSEGKCQRADELVVVLGSGNLAGGVCGGDHQCVRHGTYLEDSGGFTHDVKFIPGGVQVDGKIQDAECHYKRIDENGKSELMMSCLPNSENKIISNANGELIYEAFRQDRYVTGLMNGFGGFHWQYSCVQKDKCADTVDNDGIENLHEEYNLYDIGISGLAPLKLRDLDDVDCKQYLPNQEGPTAGLGISPFLNQPYCIDNDQDGYCENSALFPDCDGDPSDDASQYGTKVDLTTEMFDELDSKDQCPTRCQNYCNNLNLEKGKSDYCSVVNIDYCNDKTERFNDLSIHSKERIKFLSDFKGPIIAQCTFRLKSDNKLQFKPKFYESASWLSTQDTDTANVDSCNNFCYSIFDGINAGSIGPGLYSKKKAVDFESNLEIGIFKQLFGNGKQCNCKILIEDQNINSYTGSISITAKAVHPFSSLVLPKEGIQPFSDVCGISNQDLNCNKNMVDGWDFSAFKNLNNGPIAPATLGSYTPFDNNPSTGIECYAPDEKCYGTDFLGMDLACNFPSVNEVTVEKITEFKYHVATMALQDYPILKLSTLIVQRGWMTMIGLKGFLYGTTFPLGAYHLSTAANEFSNGFTEESIENLAYFGFDAVPTAHLSHNLQKAGFWRLLFNKYYPRYPGGGLDSTRYLEDFAVIDTQALVRVSLPKMEDYNKGITKSPGAFVELVLNPDDPSMKNSIIRNLDSLGYNGEKFVNQHPEVAIKIGSDRIVPPTTDKLIAVAPSEHALEISRNGILPNHFNSKIIRGMLHLDMQGEVFLFADVQAAKEAAAIIYQTSGKPAFGYMIEVPNPTLVPAIIGTGSVTKGGIIKVTNDFDNWVDVSSIEKPIGQNSFEGNPPLEITPQIIYGSLSKQDAINILQNGVPTYDRGAAEANYPGARFVFLKDPNKNAEIKSIKKPDATPSGQILSNNNKGDVGEYLLSEALGWDVVPATIYKNGASYQFIVEGSNTNLMLELDLSSYLPIELGNGAEIIVGTNFWKDARKVYLLTLISGNSDRFSIRDTDRIVGNIGAKDGKLFAFDGSETGRTYIKDNYIFVEGLSITGYLQTNKVDSPLLTYEEYLSLHKFLNNPDLPGIARYFDYPANAQKPAWMKLSERSNEYEPTMRSIIQLMLSRFESEKPALRLSTQDSQDLVAGRVTVEQLVKRDLDKSSPCPARSDDGCVHVGLPVPAELSNPSYKDSDVIHDIYAPLPGLSDAINLLSNGRLAERTFSSGVRAQEVSIGMPPFNGKYMVQSSKQEMSLISWEALGKPDSRNVRGLNGIFPVESGETRLLANSKEDFDSLVSELSRLYPQEAKSIPSGVTMVVNGKAIDVVTFDANHITGLSQIKTEIFDANLVIRNFAKGNPKNTPIPIDITSRAHYWTNLLQNYILIGDFTRRTFDQRSLSYLQETIQKDPRFAGKVSVLLCDAGICDVAINGKRFNIQSELSVKIIKAKLGIRDVDAIEPSFLGHTAVTDFFKRTIIVPGEEESAIDQLKQFLSEGVLREEDVGGTRKGVLLEQGFGTDSSTLRKIHVRFAYDLFDLPGGSSIVELEPRIFIPSLTSNQFVTQGPVPIVSGKTQIIISDKALFDEVLDSLRNAHLIDEEFSVIGGSTVIIKGKIVDIMNIEPIIVKEIAPLRAELERINGLIARLPVSSGNTVLIGERTFFSSTLSSVESKADAARKSSVVDLIRLKYPTKAVTVQRCEPEACYLDFFGSAHLIQYGNNFDIRLIDTKIQEIIDANEAAQASEPAIPKKNIFGVYSSKEYLSYFLAQSLDAKNAASVLDSGLAPIMQLSTPTNPDGTRTRIDGVSLYRGFREIIAQYKIMKMNFGYLFEFKPQLASTDPNAHIRLYPLNEVAGGVHLGEIGNVGSREFIIPSRDTRIIAEDNAKIESLIFELKSRGILESEEDIVGGKTIRARGREIDIITLDRWLIDNHDAINKGFLQSQISPEQPLKNYWSAIFNLYYSSINERTKSYVENLIKIEFETSGLITQSCESRICTLVSSRGRMYTVDFAAPFTIEEQIDSIINSDSFSDPVPANPNRLIDHPEIQKFVNADSEAGVQDIDRTMAYIRPIAFKHNLHVQEMNSCTTQSCIIRLLKNNDKLALKIANEIYSEDFPKEKTQISTILKPMVQSALAKEYFKDKKLTTILSTADLYIVDKYGLAGFSELEAEYIYVFGVDFKIFEEFADLGIFDLRTGIARSGVPAVTDGNINLINEIGTQPGTESELKYSLSTLIKLIDANKLQLFRVGEELGSATLRFNTLKTFPKYIQRLVYYPEIVIIEIKPGHGTLKDGTYTAFIDETGNIHVDSLTKTPSGQPVFELNKLSWEDITVKGEKSQLDTLKAIFPKMNTEKSASNDRGINPVVD